jgi:hypothetical protein
MIGLSLSSVSKHNRWSCYDWVVVVVFRLLTQYVVIKPLVAHGGKALITMGFECNESHPEFTQRHQRLLQIYTDNIDKQFSSNKALSA